MSNTSAGACHLAGKFLALPPALLRAPEGGVGGWRGGGAPHDAGAAPLACAGLRAQNKAQTSRMDTMYEIIKQRAGPQEREAVHLFRLLLHPTSFSQVAPRTPPAPGPAPPRPHALCSPLPSLQRPRAAHAAASAQHAWGGVAQRGTGAGPAGDLGHRRQLRGPRAPLG